MITLVLTDSIGKHLRTLADLPVESAGVLLARLVDSPDGHLRLLARQFIDVPASAYVERTAHWLDITTEGYVPALKIAETEACIPIWVHTHPGDESSPCPSSHDRRVDEQLSDLFRWRSGSIYYSALIVSRQAGRLAFTGHVDDGATQRPIDRLVQVGARLGLQFNDQAELEPLPDLFDRQIRAFGGGVQQALGALRVAVVGCGGTGSAVAEQLARLGVRHLILVDPDTLSISNVTRVYGSTPNDVGRPKVEVLRNHLVGVAPETNVTTIRGMVTEQAVARAVASVDVLFGCTDDNAGRLILSRLATYCLIPVIDCAVLLTSDEDHSLDGIHGRVTVLHPGAACLDCRGRIDRSRALSEQLTPTERKRLADEGYAQHLDGVEPAVITFTTAVAAAAVSELLERLTVFGPTPVPSEVLLRLHEREISTNIIPPRERHFCDPAAGKLGFGGTTPFLECVWRA